MGDVVANTISFSIMLILWAICPYQVAKYMLRLNMRKRIWYKLILFLILYSVFLVVVEIFTPFWQSEYKQDEMTIVHNLVDKALMYISFFICMLIMTKEKWYYSALYSIASFSFFAMILSLVSYSIGIIFLILKVDISNPVVDFIIGLLSQALIIIIVIVISKYYKIRNKVLLSKQTKKEHIYVFILIFVNTIIFGAIVTVYDDINITNYLTSILWFAFILIQVMALIYMIDARMILKERNILNQNYLKLQEEHYQSIMEKDLKLRKLRHDMKHHLYMLRMLNEEGEQEEMSTYLNSIADTLDKDISLS